MYMYVCINNLSKLTLDFISSKAGLYRAMDLGRPGPPFLSSGYVIQTTEVIVRRDNCQILKQRKILFQFNQSC